MAADVTSSPQMAADTGAAARHTKWLLGRIGRGDQVQADTRAALQGGVEHVPATEMLGRKVGGDQEVERHAAALSSSSHWRYTGVSSAIRVRDGLRRTEV